MSLILCEKTGEIAVFNAVLSPSPGGIPPAGWVELQGLSAFNSHRFSAFRKRSGLTQKEFGALCKPRVGFRDISRFERGERIPSLEQVVDFGRVLKISPAELLIDTISAFSRAVGLLLNLWEIEVWETGELPETPRYYEVSLMIRDYLVFSNRVHEHFREW